MRRLEHKPAARVDIRNALEMSRSIFGARAKRDYKALIDRALILLCEKPDRAGVQRRDDLAGAPCLFHLRHARQRGASPKEPRHVIVFTYDDAAVDVLRVLYDAMDFASTSASQESNLVARAALLPISAPRPILPT